MPYELYSDLGNFNNELLLNKKTFKVVTKTSSF